MRIVLFATLLAAVAAAEARAQGLTPAEFNASRAYRHFLNSPSSLRTYSGLTPGRTVLRDTPFGYEIYSRGPGYLHQRISHRGFESFEVVPGRSFEFVPYYPGPLYAPAFPPR